MKNTNELSVSATPRVLKLNRERLRVLSLNVADLEGVAGGGIVRSNPAPNNDGC